MNSLDVLRERGFVQDVSDEAGLRAALERPITAYDGFDPTRDSLQVGNLVGIMMLAHLQRGGHRPIALLGGGTVMIGDPTGKTEMREMLALEQISSNARGVLRQFARYLDFTDGRALLLNNADWLLELRYIDFLREYGRHFTVNQLMQHETYRDRLQQGSLSFIELNYALAQAYDFLHLFRTHDCLLQIGGSDQWFNILAGVELIRRAEGRQAFALVSPLMSTSSGAKMGKTERGAVWLDPAKTSPYEYYQFWRNTEDRDVERFLKLFTFLPLEEIRELGRLEGAELNRAKDVLAYQATTLTHGQQAAAEAQETARSVFGGQRTATANLPTWRVRSELLAAGLDLLDALVSTGLAQSKTVAKAHLAGGGVYVNGERVSRERVTLSLGDLQDGEILLRRGQKAYARVVVDTERASR